VKFMDCLMKHNYPLKDMSTRHENGLSRSNDLRRNPKAGCATFVKKLELTIRRQMGKSVIIPKFSLYNGRSPCCNCTNIAMRLFLIRLQNVFL
jgi:hypothetical protein